jgi:hypothetical protein
MTFAYERIMNKTIDDNKIQTEILLIIATPLPWPVAWKNHFIQAPN